MTSEKRSQRTARSSKGIQNTMKHAVNQPKRVFVAAAAIAINTLLERITPKTTGGVAVAEGFRDISR